MSTSKAREQCRALFANALRWHCCARLDRRGILLSDQERCDVLKSAREAAAPNKVLIAGTGIESASERCVLPSTPLDSATT